MTEHVHIWKTHYALLLPPSFISQLWQAVFPFFQENILPIFGEIVFLFPSSNSNPCTWVSCHVLMWFHSLGHCWLVQGGHLTQAGPISAFPWNLKNQNRGGEPVGGQKPYCHLCKRKACSRTACGWCTDRKGPGTSCIQRSRRGFVHPDPVAWRFNPSLYSNKFLN